MNFQDHLNTVKKQTFDMAIITDSKGKSSGKIVVRYTDSQIGYNNQTGIVLYRYDLDYGTTRKGSTYDQDSVFHLLRGIGAKVYNHSGVEFCTYGDKKREGKINADSISRCTEFVSFKIGRAKFTIHWV